MIKSTVDIEELGAVRTLVFKELNQLVSLWERIFFILFSMFRSLQRSRDSGGRNEGSEVKQQIASLEYLKQFIDSRLSRIDKGPETDSMGKKCSIPLPSLLLILLLISLKGCL